MACIPLVTVGVDDLNSCMRNCHVSSAGGVGKGAIFRAIRAQVPCHCNYTSLAETNCGKLAAGLRGGSLISHGIMFVENICAQGRSFVF